MCQVQKQENITSLCQPWDLTKNSSPDAEICSCGKVLAKHHCRPLRKNLRERSFTPPYTAQGSPLMAMLPQQLRWSPSPAVTTQPRPQDRWESCSE